MAIKIRLHPFLHHFTGGREMVEVEGHNVKECLESLQTQFPGIMESLGKKRGNSFQLFHYVEIYVNGESAYPEELTKLVKDGDEVSIVFMMAGG